MARQVCLEPTGRRWQAIRSSLTDLRKRKSPQRAGLETTIYMAHPAGFEPTTPPSEGNAVQESWLAASTVKCL